MKIFRTLSIAIVASTMILCTGLAENTPTPISIAQLGQLADGIELSADQAKSWETIEKKGQESMVKAKESVKELREKGLARNSDEMQLAITALRLVNKKAESDFVALLDDKQLESYKASREVLNKRPRMELSNSLNPDGGSQNP